MCCLCGFLVELSSCRATYENCNKSLVFFNLVQGEWMDLRNSSGIELRTSTLQPYGSFFRKGSSKVEKCIMWNSIQVLPNQESKKSFHTFKDIDLRESHAKLHKNRVKLWEQIEFKGQKSVSTVFLGILMDFQCILHSVRLQK